jgi:hypothetical protein
VKPTFDRFDFGGLDVRDFGKLRERTRISLANGRVGVIMSYPTRNIPDRVTVTWTKFSKMLKDVDVVLIGPDDKVEKKQFSHYLANNTIEWLNPGFPPLPDVVDVRFDESSLDRSVNLPLISLICGFLALGLAGLSLIGVVSGRHGFWVGAVLLVAALIAWPSKMSLELPFTPLKPIPTADADRVFSALHTNLFRAFDYKSEEDVYDALAQTTEGPLLKKVYLDMRRSLEIEEQGGAVANLDRIEIMEGEPVAGMGTATRILPPDFAYRCIWELEGTVEHWGHIHRRTNRYEALFHVRRVDGLWKFTEFQTLNEEQGQIVRSLRKF